MYKLFIFYFLFFIFFACNDAILQEDFVAYSPDSLLKMNQQYIQQEKKMIAKFVEQQKWIAVKQTPRGVFYTIHHKGNNDVLAIGDYVTISYQVSNLSGKVLQHFKEKVKNNFVLGKEDLPAGLQELLLELHKGDSVKAIIPYFLAFGLTGDGQKVGVKTSLFYEIFIKNE